MNLDLKKGALTDYVKENYGSNGFTKEGNIKIVVLKDIKKNGSKIARKRANFSLSSRKWNHDRKDGEKAKKQGRKN